MQDQLWHIYALLLIYTLLNPSSTGWNVYRTQEDCLQEAKSVDSSPQPSAASAATAPPNAADLSPPLNDISQGSQSLPSASQQQSIPRNITPPTQASSSEPPLWSEAPADTELPDWAEKARQKAVSARQMRLPSTVIPASEKAEACWVVLSVFPIRKW